MCHRLWQGDCTCKQVVNRLKIPQGLFTLLFQRWSPQGEESAVIHHKKNYRLYKDATCHNIWACDFTVVAVFFSLFFLALHYCFFLYIFFLLWLFLWLFYFLPSSFSWLCCSFSRAPFSPECCFSWLFLWPFLPILLGGCFLALRRAPTSSDWFFLWHSLRPSSTQLLRNHSGVFSH